jgi:membrane-associated protein
VGIGLFVSGLILFGVATVMVETQILSLWQIAPLAFLGALLGDHVGYYVGFYFGPRFHQFRLAQRYRKQMERGERLILRYGPSTIFIGRFLPAIRSLLPAMLGISGFARARYSLLDTIACALWSVALVGLVALTGGLI